MRTTLNLDDSALESAMQYAKGQTKTQVINEALREFVRRMRQRELLEWQGRAAWDGDLDRLRKRT